MLSNNNLFLCARLPHGSPSSLSGACRAKGRGGGSVYPDPSAAFERWCLSTARPKAKLGDRMRHVTATVISGHTETERATGWIALIGRSAAQRSPPPLLAAARRCPPNPTLHHHHLHHQTRKQNFCISAPLERDPRTQKRRTRCRAFVLAASTASGRRETSRRVVCLSDGEGARALVERGSLHLCT